jgi:hypothetical protein
MNFVSKLALTIQVLLHRAKKGNRDMGALIVLAFVGLYVAAYGFAKGNLPAMVGGGALCLASLLYFLSRLREWMRGHSYTVLLPRTPRGRK